MRSRNWLPAVCSSSAGSWPCRVIASNTCRPRSFGTGTASRSCPSISRAKPLICWPSASGNCSSPSITRRLGLWKTSSIRVWAIPACTSPSMLACRSSIGCSASETAISTGGRRICLPCCATAGAIAPSNMPTIQHRRQLTRLIAVLRPRVGTSNAPPAKTGLAVRPSSQPAPVVAVRLAQAPSPCPAHCAGFRRRTTPAAPAPAQAGSESSPSSLRRDLSSGR